MKGLRSLLTGIFIISLGILYHLYLRGANHENVNPNLDTLGVTIEPTPVKTAPAFIGTLRQYIHATGTTFPIREAQITARVNGTLTRLSVIEGQGVHSGDTLAIIDDELLDI